MKILAELRKLNPESFTEYYRFIVRFVEHMQILADAGLRSMDDLFPELITSIADLRDEDLAKVKHLFENITFTNDSIYRGVLEFSRVTLLSIFEAAASERPSVNKAQRPRGIYLESTQEIYKKTKEEIERHLKDYFLKEKEKLSHLKNKLIKTNIDEDRKLRFSKLIAAIGNHGLQLKQHYHVEPAKAQVLIELAIKLQVLFDVHYESNEYVSTEYEFFQQLTQAAEAVLQSTNNQQALLTYHRDWLTRKINELIVFLNLLFSDKNATKKPGFFMPIQTKSTQLVAALIQDGHKTTDFEECKPLFH